jgi:hypothetical protein
MNAFTLQSLAYHTCTSSMHYARAQSLPGHVHLPACPLRQVHSKNSEVIDRPTDRLEADPIREFSETYDNWNVWRKTHYNARMDEGVSEHTGRSADETLLRATAEATRDDL